MSIFEYNCVNDPDYLANFIWFSDDKQKIETSKITELISTSPIIIHPTGYPEHNQHCTVKTCSLGLGLNLEGKQLTTGCLNFDLTGSAEILKAIRSKQNINEKVHKKFIYYDLT